MAVDIGDVVSLEDSGHFAAVGTFLTGDQDCIQIGGYDVAFDFPSSAGVSGSGSKNFGFRNIKLRFKAYLVRADANTIISDYDSYSVESVGPVDIVVGGTTYSRCFLDANGSVLGNIKDCGLGGFFAEMILAFNSKGGS